MPKHIIRTANPSYRFSAGKATEAHEKKAGTERKPSMPALSSCGCVFCDLRLTPNISGMHATPDGAVKCTRVR